MIAFERGNPRVMAVIELARSHDVPVHIPAGVLAQAWRASPRQAILAALLKQEFVRVPELNRAAALEIGKLLALRGGADVIDAHVALVALMTGSTVMTSDPDDLRALAPQLTLVAV